MQTVAKCLAWIGVLGMCHIVRLTLTYLTYGGASEPSKNRIIIFSSFFPCVAMSGLWLLRCPPLSIRVVGWTMVGILQVETLGVLLLALFHKEFTGDDQFRINYLCVTLPAILCAGWWMMWRISKKREL